MATQKQRQAARKNVREAQRGARQQKSITKLPKKTRTALGREGAKAAARKRGASKGTGSGTGAMTGCEGLGPVGCDAAGGAAADDDVVEAFAHALVPSSPVQSKAIPCPGRPGARAKPSSIRRGSAM